jgi:LmbE family N-acetylglucosaminyl deacetylase
MGGYLANRRGRLRCTYVSCFSQVVDTVSPEEHASANDVSAVRRDETSRCARDLGCHVRFLDYPAAEIRQVLFPAERRERREEGVRRALTLDLYRLVADLDPGELFAPAGAGEHPDHRMLFEIALDFFKQGYFPGLRIHFYADFPDAADYLHVDDFLSRFERAYADVVSWWEDVSAALAEKRRLAAIYESALSDAELRAVERIARRDALLCDAGPGAAPPAAAEPFWTLTELPAAPA